MEFITITIPAKRFEEIVRTLSLKSEVDYKVKSVKVIDDMFINDPMHRELKAKADKCYKQLQDYEFKKRHNIHGK